MRISLWAIILMPIAQSEAFIFELQSIKKKDAIEGPTWVIGLGDLHDKKHPIIQEQKDAIMHFLRMLPKDKVKVLTEDLSSPGSFGRGSCDNYYINSRGGVLGGLTQECRDKGFDAENHEFRYCRVSSLGPVMNDISADITQIGSTSTISVNSLYQEIQKELDHINAFDDGELLTKEYDKNIKEVRKKLAQLEITEADATSVAEYLKKRVHDAKNKLIHFIKKLLIFDSELLDCKLVHAIKQEKEKEYIIIIAGGSHVKRVCDLLIKDGYEPHTIMLAQDEKTTEEAQCAGRPLIRGKHCVVPKAIDLSCLPNCCDLKR